MSNKPTSTDDIENVEPQSKLEAFYDEVVAAAEGLANSFIKKAEARVPESLIPDEELLRYEAHNKISNKENEEVLIEQTFSNGNGHVIPRVKHDGHNASVKSSKQNLHQAISITITDEAAAKAIATNFGQNKTADFSNKIETKPLEHTEVTVRGHHPITKATHFIPQLHEAKAAHQAVVVVPGIIPVAVVPVPAPVHVVPVPVHVAPVPVHVVPVPVIPPAPVNNLAPVVPVVNNQQGGLLQGILGMLNNLRPTVIIHGNQPPLPAPVQVQIDPLVNNFVGDLVNPNPVPVPVHTIPAPITTAVGPDLTQVAPVQQDGGVLNIIGNFFHNLRPSVLATGNQEAEPVVKDLIQDMMLAEPSRTEQKDVPVPVAVDQFDPLVDDYVNDLFPNVIPNSVPVPKPLQEDKKDNGLQDADQEVDSFVDDMNKPAQSEQKESTKVEGTDTSATPDVAPVTTPVQPVGGLLDFLNGWRPSHLVTGTQRSAEKDLPLEQKSKMKIFAPELLDFDEQEIEDTDNQHMAEEMALGVLEDDDSEPTFKHVDPVDAFVGDMTGWSNPTPPTNGGSIWGPFALPKFTFGAKKQSPQSRTLTASEIEAVEDFVKDAVPTDSKTVSSLEPVQPQHDPLSVPVPQVDLSSGLLEQSGVRHLASTSLEDKSVQKFVKDITLKPEADATSLDTTKKADVQDFVQKIAEFVPVELDSLPTPNSSNHVDVETEQQENGTTTPDITHVPVLDESLHQPASLDAPVQIFVQDMFVGTKDPVEIPKNNVVISDEQPAELGSVSTPDLSKRVETEQQEDSSIVDEFVQEISAQPTTPDAKKKPAVLTTEELDDAQNFAHDVAVNTSDEQPAELGSVSTPDLSKRVETEQHENGSITPDVTLLSVPVPQVDLSSGLLEQSGVSHLASTSLEDKSVRKFVKDLVGLPKNTVDISDQQPTDSSSHVETEQRDNSTTDVTPVQHTASLDEPVQMFVQDMFAGTKDPVELPKNTVDISDSEQRDNSTTTLDVTPVQHTASLDEPVQMFVQDMFVATKDPVEIPKNNVVISDEQPAELGSVSTPDLSKRVETEQQEDSSIVDEFVQEISAQPTTPDAKKKPAALTTEELDDAQNFAHDVAVNTSDEQPAELDLLSTPHSKIHVETEQHENGTTTLDITHIPVEQTESLAISHHNASPSIELDVNDESVNTFSLQKDFAGLKMVVDGYAVNQTGLMKHVAETLAQIKPDVITKSMLAVEQAPNADLIIQTGIEVTLFKRLANDASHFAHEYVKEAAGNIILAKVENYEEVAELLPTMNPDNDELIGYLIVDLKKAIEIADNLDRLNQYATLVEEKCQHIAESFQALQEQAADFGKLLAETSGNSLSKSQEIELDDILRTTEDLLGHTIDRTPLTQREKKALAKDLNLSEIEALMRLDEKLGHGTPELDLFDDSYFSLDGLEPKSSNPTDLGVDTKKIVVEKPVLTTSQSELMEYFDQIEDSPISDKDVAAFVEELNGLPISQVQPAQVQSKQLTESEVASVESFVNDAVRAPVQTISVEPTPTIDPLLVQEVSELRREIDDINNELAVYKKLLEEQAKLKEQAEVDAFTQDITAPSTVPVVPQIESDDVVNTFVKDAVGPLLPNLVQSVLDISKAPNPSNGLLTGASLVDTVLDTPHPQEATKLVTDVIGDVQGMMKNSSNAQPTQAASIFSGLFTGVLKNVGGEQKAKKASLITFQSATGNLPVIALQQPRRGRFAARKPLDQKTVAPKVVKEKVDVEVDKVKVDNFLDDIFATQPATNSTPSLVVPVVETVDQTQKTLLPASSPVHSSGEKSVLSTSDVIQHESDIVGLDVSPQPIRVDLLLEAKHLLENAQLKLEVAQQQFAEAKGELTILSENEIVGADLLGIQLANKEPHQQAEAALKLKDEANVKLQQALNEVNVELHGPSDESAAPTVEAIQIELSKLIVANTISPEDGKLGETDFGQMMINIDKQGHFDKFKQMSDRIEHLDSTAKAWKSVSDAFDNLVTTEKAVKEADMLHADATKGYEEIQVDQLVHEMNRQHVDLHAGEQTLQTAAPILPQIETVVTGEAHL